MFIPSKVDRIQQSLKQLLCLYVLVNVNSNCCICLFYLGTVVYEEFEKIMEEELLSQTNPEFDLLEAFR